MTVVKLSQITAATDAELAKLIADQRSALAQAAIDYRTKEVKDVKQIGRIKRVIAQGLTVQRERSLATEEATK